MKNKFRYLCPSFKQETATAAKNLRKQNELQINSLPPRLTIYEKWHFPFQGALTVLKLPGETRNM